MLIRSSHRKVSSLLKGSSSFALLAVPSLTLGLSLSIWQGQITSIRMFLLCIMLTTMVVIAEYISWKFFFKSPRDTYFGKGSPEVLIRLITLSIVMGLLFELGTQKGAQCVSPLHLSDWQPFRICLFAFGSFLLLLFISCMVKPRNNDGSSIIALRGLITNRNEKKVLIRLSLFIIVILTSFFVANFGNSALKLAPLPLFFLSASACSLLVAIISSMRNRSFNPSTIFIVIVLGTGMSIISAFPASNMLSWDDEVHYSNALQLSYIMQPEASPSDSMMQRVNIIEPGFSRDGTLGRIEIAYSRGRTWTQQEFAYDQSRTWSQQDIVEFSSELDANDIDQPIDGVSGVAPIVTNYSALAYIPSAFGLWLGRLLGLSFTLTFALGKTFNLLCYALIVFMAIRIIPVKKWLYLAIGLLPTNIFTASNYSYDWFLTAFTMLAIAFIVRAICSDAKVRSRDLWLILICFFLALSPKAVYLPIVGLVLLVPRRSFESLTQRRIFIAAAIVIVLYACATFLLPVLFSGGTAYGDARAGAGASPSLQINFILSHPIAYLKILASYLVHEFFALGNIETAFADFYYMGQLTEVFPIFQGVLLVCATFIALTDSNSLSAKLISVRSIIWSLFIVLCIAALISSALYVSFTEVGLNTVIGVQPRYALPLIPLAGVFIFNFRMINRIPSPHFETAMMTLSGGFPILTVWLFIVSRVLI